MKDSHGKDQADCVVTFQELHFTGPDFKNSPAWSSMTTCKFYGWNELTGLGNETQVPIQQSWSVLLP